MPWKGIVLLARSETPGINEKKFPSPERAMY
jgi:hypothetical protein